MIYAKYHDKTLFSHNFRMKMTKKSENWRIHSHCGIQGCVCVGGGGIGGSIKSRATKFRKHGLHHWKEQIWLFQVIYAKYHDKTLVSHNFRMKMTKK